MKSEVTELSNLLDKTTSDYTTFIRSTNSSVAYSDVPVNKAVLPTDVAARLDSTGLNEVYGPYYYQGDDSYNAFKVLAKVNAPDSIQFRQIQVMTDTEEKASTLADSIYNAVKGGADFEKVAQIYGQTGEAVWVNSRSWEGAEMDADNTKFINALINQPKNGLENLTIGQARLILQVMDKKSMQTKYKVAVIKRPVEFSKETYNSAYNKFSQFVAQNTTIEDLQKNAEENGYSLMPRRDLSSAEHYVGGVQSTGDVKRWIFAAETGEVSPLFECGENDHMMVVALEKIHKVGYRDINSVADMLRNEIRRDKKAEKIMADMKGFNTLDQVKGMNGAVSDSVKHVTFSAPAYISVTHASEPVIGAVAAKTEVNKTSAPVKGNAGVYMVQVYAKDKGTEEFDSKQEETSLANMTSRFVTNQLINDLYQKAKVTDRRYLFF